MTILRSALVKGVVGGIIGWAIGFFLVIGARLAMGLPAKWNPNLTGPAAYEPQW